MPIATRPAPLTSSQPHTQPSSALHNTITTHNPSSTTTSRLAYIWSWCRAFVRGDVPPRRPSHLVAPSLLFRACGWLRRKVGIMGLCVCVCVGGLGALLGMSLSMQDNYSCDGGAYTAQRSDTVWGVVNRRCSGDRQHAYEDVVASNPHIKAWGLAQGEVIVLPHSGG